MVDNIKNDIELCVDFWEAYFELQTTLVKLEYAIKGFDLMGDTPELTMS